MAGSRSSDESSLDSRKRRKKKNEKVVQRLFTQDEVLDIEEL